MTDGAARFRLSAGFGLPTGRVDAAVMLGSGTLEAVAAWGKFQRFRGTHLDATTNNCLTGRRAKL